jgi:hypothetical protein
LQLGDERVDDHEADDQGEDAKQPERSSGTAAEACGRHRNRAGSRQFLLLIPAVPEHTHPDWTPEVVLKLLKRAAPHAQVQNLDPGADAMATLERAIQERKVDEIIVSTVPTQLADWLRRDLPYRVKRLGLPVTVIPHEVDRADAERFREHLEKLGVIAVSGSGSTGF